MVSSGLILSHILNMKSYCLMWGYHEHWNQINTQKNQFAYSPPYSPDLILCAFLFWKLKEKLRGHALTTERQLNMAIKWTNKILKERLKLAACMYFNSCLTQFPILNRKELTECLSEFRELNYGSPKWPSRSHRVLWLWDPGITLLSDLQRIFCQRYSIHWEC